jgi:glucose/arabinose dehydrogenase
MGIRDTAYDTRNNTLLVTAIKKDDKKNCFTLGILSADMSSNSLSFSWTFEINHCEENFNSHQAGGRIQPFNEGYLLTVGDFKLPEDFGYEITEDSHLSKILLIDSDWNATIFSSGHRNPQGLVISNEIIFSSEHGPFGGDEINIIEEGKNYGWPSSAYGFTYGLENIYDLDHGGEFQEPIYFFTPSIGISEIRFYNQAEFPRWNNFLMVSSLKDMTIYTLKLDKEKTSTIHVGELYVGERIRDFTIAADGKLFLAGDLGSLIVINRTDQDIP